MPANTAAPTESASTASISVESRSAKSPPKTDGPVDVQPEIDRTKPGTSSRIGRAKAIIQRNVMWSLGAGVVPIPIVDILAITGVQVNMMKELSELYRREGFRPKKAKSIVYALLVSLGSVGVGSIVGSSLAKLLPAIGTTLGIISVPIVAGAFTHAVGKVFLMHLESGGTLDDFEASDWEVSFQREYREAEVPAAQGKN
jgi:uncharacterized protein (DUF697 family)